MKFRPSSVPIPDPHFSLYLEKRYGSRQPGAVSFFWRLLFPVVLVLSVLLSGAGVIAGDSGSVSQLLQAAREKRLHEDRYWHILLHYKKTFSGIESQVDDPKFFVAQNGKTDPEAELAATIRLLFDPESGENEVCRFHARFHWLREMLGNDAVPSLPDRECPGIDDIEPRRVSLVFPTYNMNNPASIFGHTLLIIDTAYTSRRLSNAVNFAAYTEGYNGAMLAVKGLTGQFKGYYSVMPYYKKIAEYSDIGQRDIWEYELNLTLEELRRMIRHIRELEQIYTDYYFFTENCSQGILYLIEAARPSVHLTDRFHISAIPIDTIKAIREEGLIAGVQYRPAKATRINFLFNFLEGGEVGRVLSTVRGETEPGAILEEKIGLEEKIRILDLAGEVVQYRFINGDIERPEYRKQLVATLKARSTLGQSESDPVEKIPTPPYPEQGHDSRRLSAGVGASGGDLFYELRYRQTLTDLTDPDFINNQGAQLEIGDLRGRYYPEDDRFALRQLDIIDIVSLTPVDAYFKPISWLANTGWDRKPIGGDSDALFYKANVGAGYSARVPILGLCHLLAETEFNIGNDLDADYAFGGGAAVGTILQAGKAARIHLSARALRFFAGDSHTHYRTNVIATRRIARNHQASIDFEWENVSPEERYEVQALWSVFF